MLKQLEELKSNALKELEAVSQAKDLEAWRVRYLGKKSQLTGVLRGLTKLPIEERKQVGALANRIKAGLEENLEQKSRLLKQAGLAATGGEGIDVTLPGRPYPRPLPKSATYSPPWDFRWWRGRRWNGTTTTLRH